MKLLLLLSRVPYPLEKGDKLRAYHLMTRLAQKHEVILCCLSDTPTSEEDIAHLHQFCTHIEVIRVPRWRIILKLASAVFSRLPFQVAYFHHRVAQRVIDKVIREHRPDHVLCQLVRTTEYMRSHPTLPKTLDYMDTLSKGMERRTENAPFYIKPLLLAETRRLIRYENLMFDLFDHAMIISAQDREYIYHPLRDRVHVIPNGVDTSYFKPQDSEKNYDLLFTGNMNYPPNIDSVLFLVQHVLPIVRKTRPETSLLISGVDPSASVRDLAKTDPLVNVSGWVKDIRSSYAAARIFVAPMQIGTGLQNKILEAMAMRMPCITSALANNAVGAEAGDSILIGNTPKDYANHILRLLADTDERDRLAESGYRFVLERFDWDRAATDLDAIIRSTPPVAAKTAAL
ncbi:MAG: glycosyltransferase [Flavobacteriales bacterium]|nr:glycosyltransferase [Flavobacteriales bacterium]MBK7481758.1 glycosyltransferase [Flavobacteriales bacterium]